VTTAMAVQAYRSRSTRPPESGSGACAAERRRTTSIDVARPRTGTASSIERLSRSLAEASLSSGAGRCHVEPGIAERPGHILKESGAGVDAQRRSCSHEGAQIGVGERQRFPGAWGHRSFRERGKNCSAAALGIFVL